MGMDVFGKNPSTEAGAYFRNNVWWWRPLAEYCLEQHPDLTNACTYWHSNDGDGLDADGAQALALALREDLDAGRVAAYAKEREECIASLPRETCRWCEGKGVRTDDEGRSLGQDVPRDPETGQGGCRMCEGQGTEEPWIAHYPFSEDNVRKFAEFLAGCGGFEIC